MSLSSPLFCDTCGAANRAQAQFCRACGRPLRPQSPQPAASSPTLTGLLNIHSLLKQRYTILGPAGRGGFGAVYRAADTQFGNRVVAIKEMSQNSLNEQELQAATEAFKNEALLLANLKHPNLPSIYDQFSENSRFYLVMDFIEGETLEEHLNKLNGAKLPIEKVLEIGIQLCSVLDYLHTREPAIIFRDLKPANIMLTQGDNLYLIDFGIARHFKPGKAKDTAALGSAGYAAPEQYGRSQTTARSDIYSLGATLHQLLTGENPADTPFQFSPLRLTEPTLTGLDKLIMSMVSVEITKRPASAAIVKKELHNISVQHTTTVPLNNFRVPAGYQAPRPTKTGSKGKQSSQLTFRPQPNTLYVCSGHTGRVTALAWSPDNKILASASYDKAVQLWEGEKGSAILTYHKHLERVNALAWSPDSKRIASASDDGTVHVWNALSKQTVRTYTEHSGPVCAVAWSPNGLYIASAGLDKTVHVWDASTGQRVFTYTGHTGKIYTLAWSPDSKRIASGGEDKKIQFWEPIKETPKRSLLASLTNLITQHRGPLTINKHEGRINELAWSCDGKYLASTGADHLTAIWDTLTGQLVFKPKPQSNSMKNALAWSPVSSHLAMGGNDKMVEIWNMDSKKLVYTYCGHVGYIMAIAWAPNGERVASSGVDRSIQVWKTTTISGIIK
ncbi:serine/threonine-protein kinase [Ktedonosporobacter rubrisoli]|nr:serine/threonine-protein kinase [Ktedonosporobacter rubrisoli]